MNAKQALVRLQKLWGKHAGFQDNKKTTSPELREAAHKARRAAKSGKDMAEAALTARRETILAGDLEYQRLKAKYQEARKAMDLAPWPGYRYSAGIIGSMFFTVKARADNLDELVAIAESKDKTAA